ncbi:MAG: hypothetical protein NTV54_03225 [Ignavibacteriales bacterium]|nr:hypothetical protein [Ignavibacteriales bacterium]
MHYRFKYFLPGADLSILLFIKDAHLFPVHIESVIATVRPAGSQEPLTVLLPVDPETISQKFWWRVISVPLSRHLPQCSGALFISVEFTYTISGKSRRCTNDNYRTTAKGPLRVFVSPTPLPRLPGWFLGDAHTHSYHTEDQVEFGAPPAASVALSKSMGLSFFCITDHSYDLDDSDDNYLINDPALPKWNRLQSEIDTLNSEEKTFAIVRGEEVSCWNTARENVHLLLYGTRRFFPGSGDGAERWFRTKAEHTIKEVVASIDDTVAAFAAHPLEHVPFLHRIFFGRGEWSEIDAAITVVPVFARIWRSSIVFPAIAAGMM